MRLKLGQRSAHASAFAAIVVFMILLGIARDGEASAFFFYRFTPIADTQGGLPYQNLSGFPAMNSSGRIAFRARLTGGVEGMFSRLGSGGVDTLADSSEFNFGFGINPSINSLNTVLFVGLKQEQNGIVETFLRGQGASATKLVSSSDNLFQFCGTQINIEGTAAFRAKRGDGRQVILAQGQGPLNGVVRTIAVEGAEFSSLGCGPSIGFDGTVAFTATRANGRRAILTRAKNGQLTVVAENTSTFAGFGELALNQQGGIAFQAPLQGGGLALFRIRNGALTRVANYNVPGAGGPAGFSVNESGLVAYEYSFGANGSSVHLGPNSVFGRLIGTGSVLFGRTVAFAHIHRDALNSTGQIAVWIVFTDRSEMIARGDPVNVLDSIVATGALQLSTLAGRSVSIGTPIATPPAKAVLSFELTFLTADAELAVKLGDKVVKSIPASDPGVRQRVSIPIDLAAVRDEKAGHIANLQFALSGKPGANARISDVLIPGLLADRMESDALSRWQVDTSNGGAAALVSTARLPVKIRLSYAGRNVRVAVLSTRGFDAPADIQRTSLRLAGAPVQKTRDQAGGDQLACDERDVNNDKLKDLVCDVEVARTGSSQREQRLRLEAMTQFGWGITGSDVLNGRSPASRKPSAK